MAEKIQVDYDFLVEYFNTELNVIGATTNTTLRTVDTISGDTAYVRKFGTDYLITQVTDIEDPIDVNMTFTVKSKTTNTTLGSRAGGGAFVSGSTLSTAEGCYLEISASGGDVTVLSSITIDTDVDAGGLAFVCATETVSNGDILTLYLSDTGSTYYDSGYIYGGTRHSGSINNTRKPFRTINLALTTLATGNNDGVVILDSATYDETIDCNLSDFIMQSALGQAPTICRGIGARITRSTSQEYNNTTAIYFNTNGNDANDGTWQNPVLTISHAISIAGSKKIVFGGINASNDSIFSEDLLTINNNNIESDYFYFFTIKGLGNEYVLKTIDVCQLYGFKIDGNNINTDCIQVKDTAIGAVSSIYDCNVFNASTRDVYFSTTVTNATLNIVNCEIYSSVTGVTNTGATVQNTNISYSIIRNCNIGIDHNESLATRIFLYYSGIYDNTTIGLRINYNGGTVVTHNIINNIFFNNGTGFYLNHSLGISTYNVDYNIFYGNTNYGIFSLYAITVNYSNFFNNGTDYTVNVTIVNTTTTNTLLCKTTSPYKLGIQPNSPAYRVDNTKDAGIFTAIIEINESNITINGVIIDGQDKYLKGLFIADNIDHTDLTLKWCTIENCNDGGGDFYDNDTDLDIQILKCNFNNNGYGVGLHYGGNTIQECLFYRNSIQQLYCDYGFHTINHNVFYGGEYGVYFDTNFTGALIKNSILDNNSLYSIYSVQSFSNIIYSNIINSVTSNVNISDTTNINVDPLFINITIGFENFNIKTVETNILDSNGNIIGQYATNSGCKDASDGVLYGDIGCYGVNRGIEEQAWKKYVLEFNPTNLDDQNLPKDPVEFSDAVGSYSSWAKSHKNLFPLIWSENHASSEQQLNKIKYFNSLRPSRELGKTKETTRIRFKRLPITFLATGNGTIDATGLTLTDSSGTYDEDSLKGYWVALKFDSQTNYSISASGKTATSSGAGWTVNQWTGYFLKYNGYTYYIKSNTSDTLTLSDPYSTLVNASSQSLSIEKYFEIKTNNDTIFTLYDDDSELVDGSYDYYIDFAITRAVVQDFVSTQVIYNPTKPEWNTGYSLVLEQV
jgi:hypothetical protein